MHVSRPRPHMLTSNQRGRGNDPVTVLGRIRPEVEVNIACPGLVYRLALRAWLRRYERQPKCRPVNFHLRIRKSSSSRQCRQFVSTETGTHRTKPVVNRNLTPVKNGLREF